MRVGLQQYRPNGGSAPAGQVFAVTGICQDAHFRLKPGLLVGENRPEDLALIYLGAPEFGPGTAPDASEEEPYFILRRGYLNGEVIVAARIDWEGIFTVLSNDDEYAERLFREFIQPSSPEEINRQWSSDSETVEMFQQMIAMK
jgi:hypothetical protein